MNKTKKFIVYKITNTITGRNYIGITGNYKKRMRDHSYCNGACRYLYNAINKHGWNNFTTEIIFECDSWDEAKKEEIDYIKIFNTMFPNGYNLTKGGDGCLGLKHTKKSRKKMSEALKERKVSKEHKRKISESNKGQKRSEETRKNISEAQKLLSKNQVLEIRKMLSGGIIYKTIAEKFNAHVTTIGAINRNERYTDIQLPGVDLNNLPEVNRQFSKDQVLEIRKMLSDGIMYKIIADKFNVHQETIGRIKRNAKYSDIQLP